MKNLLNLFIASFFLSALLWPQVDLPDLEAELLFDYSHFSPEEMDALLLAYSEQPLIWHRCSESDLQALPLRTDLKMTLIELHQKHPELQDWSTLRRLGNFSADEMAALKIFINFSPPHKNASDLTYYFTLLENENGLDVGKILFRWRQSPRPQYQWGTVIERDPREPNLVDHWNLSSQLNLPAYDLRLTLGAYRLHWGSGLLHAQNLMSTYTTDAVSNVIPPNIRLNPYWGSDENRYLFGTALQKSFKNASFYLFGSHNRLDAALDSQLVTSFLSDGYHITTHQIAAKNAVAETIWGLAGLLPYGQSNWGMLVEMLNYSKPVAPIDQGRHLFNFSFMHRLRWKAIQWHGELVAQTNHRWGLIENLIWTEKEVNLVLSLRYYHPGFFAPLGAPPAQLGGTSYNEQGIYGGWKIRLRRNCWWSTYLDYYHSLKTASNAAFPATGCDFVNSLNLRLKTRTRLQLTNRLYSQYQTQAKNHIQRKSTWQFRLHKDFDSYQGLNLTMTFANDFQTPHFSNSALSCYYQRRTSHLTWITGLTEYFTREGSLLYLSEPGVPLQYHLVTLSGRGYRLYGVILLRPRPGICIAGATQYSLKRSVESDARSAAFTGNVQLSVGL